MRILLSCVLFLFSALSYALVGIPIAIKTQKYGDLWTAMQYTIGVWPDTRWLDLAIVSGFTAIGTGLLCAAIRLLMRPTGK